MPETAPDEVLPPPFVENYFANPPMTKSPGVLFPSSKHALALESYILLDVTGGTPFSAQAPDFLIAFYSISRSQLLFAKGIILRRDG